jgi:putative thioredoxin
LHKLLARAVVVPLAVPTHDLDQVVDRVLAIALGVERDRKWNDDGARKQLVQLFDAWGPTDPATIEGRKRLSSVLFS